MLVYSLCSLYRRVSTVNKIQNIKPQRHCFYQFSRGFTPRVKDFYLKNHCSTLLPNMKMYMNERFNSMDFPHFIVIKRDYRKVTSNYHEA
jgi:hypothetical protein